ncbi:hypothetical protein LZ906_017480 (plasmid) [Paraclostridium ghonii]|nr:hypothetical protein [Paeniclostridium ghonii]
MSRQWVEEAIKDRLEEAKQEGNIEEVKELESLLKKRIERGLGK